jgi:hypothetical protein
VAAGRTLNALRGKDRRRSEGGYGKAFVADSITLYHTRFSSRMARPGERWGAAQELD